MTRPDEKGSGWVGPFYPTKSTKALPYYSQFFETTEFNAIYYEKFYTNMGAKTFEGMADSTPEKFEFSVKVPETITREERLGIASVNLFQEYLERIDALKKADKLGAILFQMSPNFTVKDFKNAEKFFDRLPRGYDYALEFRHPSWETEGAPELLKHYNIASVLTDSPDPKLAFLSQPIVTADHVFVRLHGRNEKFWYNYLYSKKELKSWVEKLDTVKKDAKVLRVYFNNHPGGKAVLNALQFKELTGNLNDKEKEALAKAEAYLTGKTAKSGLEQWMG